MHRRTQSVRLLELNIMRAPECGFTLIELMITIVVLAVLMMLATPSFVAMQRNSALTATANSLIAAINGARGEAMKRGMYTMVIPRVGANWASGWSVFVDTNRSQSYDPADITVMTGDALPAYLAASGTDGTTVGAVPYILYDASGYSRVIGGGFATSTLEISFVDASQRRRIKIAPTGRTRVCTPQTDLDPVCNRTG